MIPLHSEKRSAEGGWHARPILRDVSYIISVKCHGFVPEYWRAPNSEGNVKEMCYPTCPLDSLKILAGMLIKLKLCLGRTMAAKSVGFFSSITTKHSRLLLIFNAQQLARQIFSANISNPGSLCITDFFIIMRHHGCLVVMHNYVFGNKYRGYYFKPAD